MGLRVPLYVICAELGSSVSITEFETNRVCYVTRAADRTFHFGGLVPSSALAEFLKANWLELDAATRTIGLV